MAKSESGKDRISDLPEGIVHCILGRLQTPQQAGRTIILSRRWQSIWQSYPFVEFHPKDELTCSRDREHRQRIFQQFIESSIRRFSRDTDLPMKSLKVNFIDMNNDLLRDFDELLDLALRRKAEKIDIDVPLRNLPVNTPNSVRFLRLSGVGYQNFTESMANFQLLETLELHCINGLRKLQVCNLPNLKTLRISFSAFDVTEIEIAAPNLQTLSIRQIDYLTKLQLTAPQLRVLHLQAFKLQSGDISDVISNLRYLKSLKLEVSYAPVTKLKLPNPDLQELRLEVWNLKPESDLEEIEVDVCGGSSFVKFVTDFGLRHASLRKCEIKNAAAMFRWESDFIAYKPKRQWYIDFKNFVSRFRYQLDNVNIGCHSMHFNFEREEVNSITTPPAPIKRLTFHIDMNSCFSWNRGNFLEGLFWACRPRFFTIINGESYSYKQMCEVFENMMIPRYWYDPSISKEFQNFCSWQLEVKDVKIITQDIEGGEEELTSVPTNAATVLKTRDRVCFELTWL